MICYPDNIIYLILIKKLNGFSNIARYIIDIKNDEIDFIVNITEDKRAIADSYEIRRNALQNKVTYFTTIFGARAACKAMNFSNKLRVSSLQSLHKISS